MPSDKERQFFGSAERYQRGVQAFIDRTYDQSFEALKQYRARGSATRQARSR